jgi:probable phosphoglycerate mutase
VKAPLLRFHLIRHGETDYNRQRIIQGHGELPLNDLGIAQAARLARRMRERRLDVIYSSDIRRAAMTAAILASQTGAPIVWEPMLRERDPGELVHQDYEAAARFFFDAAYVPERGEGCEEFDRRVQLAFASLIDRERSITGHRF